MDFVAIDPNIGDNKKTWRVAAALGIGRAMCVGHIVMLLGKVLHHAQDGRVGDVPDELLEDWALWRGDAGRFASTFRAEFTAGGVLTGWDEYNGWMLERRRRDRERKRASSTERPRKVPGISEAIPAYRPTDLPTNQPHQQQPHARAGADVGAGAGARELEAVTPWPLTVAETLWPPHYRDSVRSSFAGMAPDLRTKLCAEIRALVDGMHGPPVPIEQLAVGFNDYVAGGHVGRRSLRQFRRFVRGVDAPEPVAAGGRGDRSGEVEKTVTALLRLGDRVKREAAR
jgi:hypothetical protein